MKPEIQELQDQITRLSARVGELEGSISRNNFTSTQVFNKACIFTDRLKVPHYSVAPSVGEVGDLIEVGAELYICTSVNPVVFTLVGSQT